MLRSNSWERCKKEVPWVPLEACRVSFLAGLLPVGCRTGVLSVRLPSPRSLMLSVETGWRRDPAGLQAGALRRPPDSKFQTDPSNNRVSASKW